MGGVLTTGQIEDCNTKTAHEIQDGDLTFLGSRLMLRPVDLRMSCLIENS